VTGVRQTSRSENGTTLIELVVAVAIMGIAFVAILGGIGTAIIGAGSQRRDATAGLLLTSAAEKIVANTQPYQACATSSTYQVPAPAPLGFRVEVMKVAHWDPSTNQFGAACPLTDAGLQLITLSVTSTAGARAPQMEVLDVVKRQVEP